MATTTSPIDATPADTAIRPFRVNVPEADLVDLHRRIAATRWPSRELVTDRSQGVQLATLQELARYWTTEHDWRACEAKLNALPQFTTEIDGVDIHFIHVRSPHEDALPLIITHGWPGSVIELLGVVDLLTNPTGTVGAPKTRLISCSRRSRLRVLQRADGGRLGRRPDRGRLGGADGPPRYTHYVAQGGDVGSAVTDAMARQAPAGLLGVHINLFLAGLLDPGPWPSASERERAAIDAVATFNTSGNGYFLEQATRPQTIGYALLDSPVALAAWLLDHDTDSYYKISRAFLDNDPAGRLTRDRLVDNITLYWLTGTGASAARSYWENGRAAARAGGQAPPEASVPVGFTAFPGELFAAPRSWVERAYPTLAYYNEVDKGGHFAAWEDPRSSPKRCAQRSDRCASETGGDGETVRAASAQRRAHQ